MYHNSQRSSTDRSRQVTIRKAIYGAFNYEMLLLVSNRVIDGWIDIRCPVSGEDGGRGRPAIEREKAFG